MPNKYIILCDSTKIPVCIYTPKKNFFFYTHGIIPRRAIKKFFFYTRGTIPRCAIKNFFFYTRSIIPRRAIKKIVSLYTWYYKRRAIKKKFSPFMSHNSLQSSNRKNGIEGCISTGMSDCPCFRRPTMYIALYHMNKIPGNNYPGVPLRLFIPYDINATGTRSIRKQKSYCAIPVYASSGRYIIKTFLSYVLGRCIHIHIYRCVVFNR